MKKIQLIFCKKMETKHGKWQFSLSIPLSWSFTKTIIIESCIYSVVPLWELKIVSS